MIGPNPLDLISSSKGIWEWGNKLNDRWPKDNRRINPEDGTSTRLVVCFLKRSTNVQSRTLFHGGKGGEMTQTLYAHMNIIKKGKKNPEHYSRD
jgi:hypothetical protein